MRPARSGARPRLTRVGGNSYHPRTGADCAPTARSARALSPRRTCLTPLSRRAAAPCRLRRGKMSFPAGSAGTVQAVFGPESRLPHLPSPIALEWYGQTLRTPLLDRWRVYDIGPGSNVSPNMAPPSVGQCLCSHARARCSPPLTDRTGRASYGSMSSVRLSRTVVEHQTHRSPTRPDRVATPEHGTRTLARCVRAMGRSGRYRRVCANVFARAMSSVGWSARPSSRTSGVRVPHRPTRIVKALVLVRWLVGLPDGNGPHRGNLPSHSDTSPCVDDMSR